MEQPLNQLRTTIFYYTGTGNSLWAARALARELGDTKLVSMTSSDIRNHIQSSEVIGLVFPVHIWGVPHRVMDFLAQLKAMSPRYIFAAATNGGQVSNTLVQLKKVMQSQGTALNAGWSLELPSNYIPWGGPGSINEQNRLFTEAAAKIPVIAAAIRRRAVIIEKGPLWQRIVFTWFYNLTYPVVPKMDQKFRTDEHCNQCGICVKLCPAQNIVMQDDKLTWQNHCEQCLRCIQWCPRQSLQYGKKTAAYARYHHPDIKVNDILK